MIVLPSRALQRKVVYRYFLSLLKSFLAQFLAQMEQLHTVFQGCITSTDKASLCNQVPAKSLALSLPMTHCFILSGSFPAYSASRCFFLFVFVFSPSYPVMPSFCSITGAFIFPSEYLIFKIFTLLKYKENKLIKQNASRITIALPSFSLWYF